MDNRLRDLCAADGYMKVTNTQFAAALAVLGYEVSSIEGSTDVVFAVPDDAMVQEHQRRWQALSQGKESDKADDSLTLMFVTARARRWVLDQVVHGKHNESLELPAKTMATDNLHFAICLVAQHQYLLKLDKSTRQFHFAPELEIEREQFNFPQPGDDYEIQRSYLKSLDQMLRVINNRNFSGQQKQAAITCGQ